MNQSSIPDKWPGLLKRLKTAGKAGRTKCVVRVAVLVDEDGNAVGWCAPDVIPIEPFSLETLDLLRFFGYNTDG